MRDLDSRYKFHVRATNPVTLTATVNTAKGFELSYNELATQPVGIVQNNNNKKLWLFLVKCRSRSQHLEGKIRLTTKMTIEITDGQTITTTTQIPIHL